MATLYGLKTFFLNQRYTVTHTRTHVHMHAHTHMHARTHTRAHTQTIIIININQTAVKTNLIFTAHGGTGKEMVIYCNSVEMVLCLFLCR